MRRDEATVDEATVWRANIDNDGRVYYYSVLRKVSKWKLPRNAKLESPGDLRTQKALLLGRILNLEEMEVRRKLQRMADGGDEKSAPKKGADVEPIDDQVFAGVNFYDEESSSSSSEASEEEEQARMTVADCLQRIEAALGWGGPVQPSHDDTIGSWCGRFLHYSWHCGPARQMVSEHNMLCRSVWYMILLVLGIVGVCYLSLHSEVSVFFEADVSPVASFVKHNGVLPSATVCAASGVRCTCEGFYADRVRESDSLLRRVLPFLCSEVVVYEQDAGMPDVDPWGWPKDYILIEDSGARVNVSATRQRMLQFVAANKTRACGPGGNDDRLHNQSANAFVEKVEAGALLPIDVLSYAGLQQLSDLVRECTAVDPVSGDKVSCLGQEYWRLSRAAVWSAAEGPCVDLAGFKDRDGDTCATWAANPTWCYGSPEDGVIDLPAEYANADGIDPGTACCVCRNQSSASTKGGGRGRGEEAVMSLAHGPCWTLNPCSGIPVGASCEINSDCSHEEGRSAPGGLCVSGQCLCTLCQSWQPGGSGESCRVLKQLQAKDVSSAAGHALGYKLTLNTFDGSTPAAFARRLERSSSGAVGGGLAGGSGIGGWVLGRPFAGVGSMVLLHSALDESKFDEAIFVPAGKTTELTLEKEVHTSKKSFPHTNCSKHTRASPLHCVTNCLRRHIARRCCNIFVPRIDRGRPPELTRNSRARLEPLETPSQKVAYDGDPLLFCSLSDAVTSTCVAEVLREFDNGFVCVPGPLTLHSRRLPYSPRQGWYNDDVVLEESEITGVTGQDVAEQEKTSLSIEQHCVYAPKQHKEYRQARHGQKCTTDSDCPLSKPSAKVSFIINNRDHSSNSSFSSKSTNTPGSRSENGTCRTAVRAYCPPSCVATKFRVVNRREANLGSHALAALAAQELALALGIGDLLREIAQARPEAVCVCGSTTAACANASCVSAAAASAAAVRFEAEKTARILALRSRILQGWLPRCLAADGNVSVPCFSQAEAEARVSQTHSILHLSYGSSKQHSFETDEAVPFYEVIGVFGAYLSLFLGVSAISGVELLEALLLLLLSLPFFVGGISMPWIRKGPPMTLEEEAEAEPDEEGYRQTSFEGEGAGLSREDCAILRHLGAVARSKYDTRHGLVSPVVSAQENDIEKKKLTPSQALLATSRAREQAKWALPVVSEEAIRDTVSPANASRVVPSETANDHDPQKLNALNEMAPELAAQWKRYMVKGDDQTGLTGVEAAVLQRFNDIDIDGNAAGHSSNAKDKSLLSRMLFWRSSARPSALDTAAPQAAPLAPAQALVAQQTASNP